jgi:glycosyltransferase involved in cell wall biosynthesis
VKVFVSVTTTNKRLDLFFYGLQSLVRQDYEDFEIVVNLSKEAYLFDDGIESIPDWMTGENVQVNFVENTGSYRKLLPLIDNVEEDDLIITADDDVLYSENWLPQLVNEAIEHPDSIVCGGARRISRNIFGRLQNYSNWPRCATPETAMDLVPIGVFGVAYRKRLVDLDFITDVAYKEHAPTADDLWFRIASIRKNTLVHVAPEVAQCNKEMKHKKGLEQTNMFQKKEPRGFFSRAGTQLRLEFCNYLGLSPSKNDLAWNAASEYSKRTLPN